MNFTARLEPLIRKHHLEELRTTIERAVCPAIHIRKQMRKEMVPGESSLFGLIRGKPKEVNHPMPIKPGGSRLGGLPDVPTNFEWPRWKGRPLSLLAQINCSEIAPLDKEQLWPKRGMVHFFYDLEEQPWGGDTKDIGSWAVRYTDETDLKTAPLPPGGEGKDFVLPAYPVSFEFFPSLPGQSTPAFEALSLDEGAAELFFELKWDVKNSASGHESIHQSLGFADNIQGPVESEWEEFAAKAGRPAGSGDWKLLLQFDSDNELNVMWGDAGIIYFGIQESSFRSQRFEDAWMIWQCS